MRTFRAIDCPTSNCDVYKRTDTPDLPPRSEMGIAYNEADDLLLVFGGHGNGGLLGDTWQFDGNIWKQLPIDNSPSPRHNVNLVFDALRKTFILFGGATADIRDGHKYVKPLNETWLWNDSAWHQQSPDASPPARYAASMVYDEARQVVLLFGGQGDKVFLNDTWLWDGKTWNAIQPSHSPSPRMYTAMAYNTTSQQVVLFGGLAVSGPLNDTWIWNGQDWEEVETETRPPLELSCAQQMTYHPTQNVVMLIGGRVIKTGDLSHDAQVKPWSELWVLE